MGVSVSRATLAAAGQRDIFFFLSPSLLFFLFDAVTARLSLCLAKSSCF
jgi:hypothetical protein